MDAPVPIDESVRAMGSSDPTAATTRFVDRLLIWSEYGPTTGPPSQNQRNYTVVIRKGLVTLVAGS